MTKELKNKTISFKHTYFYTLSEDYSKFLGGILNCLKDKKLVNRKNITYYIDICVDITGYNDEIDDSFTLSIMDFDEYDLKNKYSKLLIKAKKEFKILFGVDYDEINTLK